MAVLAPDAILASGSAGLAALLQATHMVPIVFEATITPLPSVYFLALAFTHCNSWSLSQSGVVAAF